MKNKILILLGFLIGVIVLPIKTYAQEEKLEVEDSAEVFLEEYSDDFQEKFFEALKQKGIENYDRASNLLLDCKLIDSDNKVLDHELAKVYMADKKFLLAQEYSLKAVAAEPINKWYLNTLVDVIQKQGNSIHDVKGTLPYDNKKLKENLAIIYFERRNYRASEVVLKDLTTSSFTKELRAKLDEALKGRNQKYSKKKPESSSTKAEPELNPFQRYKAQIKEQIENDNFSSLEKTSEEALESFPSQPYFYYAQGLSLYKKGRHKEAIEILEAGLDYMLGNDVAFANDMYQTLAEAYAATNNSVKSNMYLRKIKP